MTVIMSVSRSSVRGEMGGWFYDCPQYPFTFHDDKLDLSTSNTETPTPVDK